MTSPERRHAQQATAHRWGWLSQRAHDRIANAVFAAVLIVPLMFAFAAGVAACMWGRL